VRSLTHVNVLESMAVLATKIFSRIFENMVRNLGDFQLQMLLGFKGFVADWGPARLLSVGVCAGFCGEMRGMCRSGWALRLCLLSLCAWSQGKELNACQTGPEVKQVTTGEEVVGPTIRTYLCYRLPADAGQGGLRIDGRLDEAAWSKAAWSEEFVDIEGEAKPKPRYVTRMKMLWDETCLYIAAELQEPHVWGNLLVRDSVIFHDNDFELFLDPEGDGVNYGELEINALNTVWDLRLPKPYRDGGQADDGWTLGRLRTGVFVDGTLNKSTDTDTAWSIEIAIPWSDLVTLNDPEQPIRRAVRDGSVLKSYETLSEAESAAQLGGKTLPGGKTLKPQDGTQWRINFSRVEWQHEMQSGRYQRQSGVPENNWVWSPQGVIDMHRPETWGILKFTTRPAGSVELGK